MKIDIFTHVAPRKFIEVLKERVPSGFYLQEVLDLLPAISDMDKRLEIMSRYDDLVQVLTLVGPPLDMVVSAQDAVELAKIANDEMADLVSRHCDRFVGAVATLPMSDMDAALREADRAINDLGMRGVEIHTSVSGKPVDRPEFWPLYEKMSQYNLPIWIHPVRARAAADYADESHSRYLIWQVFGWPYETTVTMARLVFSGVLEKYPGIKFITHHCGAMVPYFAERIKVAYDLAEVFFKAKYKRPLRKPVIDYFKMFYCDTAIYSSRSLMCAYDLFGVDHLLFGTDMPHDSQGGHRNVRQAIQAIKQMDIPDSHKNKIFEDNARELLSLPV